MSFMFSYCLPILVKFPGGKMFWIAHTGIQPWSEHPLIFCWIPKRESVVFTDLIWPFNKVHCSVQTSRGQRWCLWRLNILSLSNQCFFVPYMFIWFLFQRQKEIGVALQGDFYKLSYLKHKSIYMVWIFLPTRSQLSEFLGTMLKAKPSQKIGQF